MAFNERSLVRLCQAPVALAAGGNDGRTISVFVYGTDEAAATVETAGFFNNARKYLTKGSLILATMANGGTPVSKMLVVLTVPSTGNVTVGQSSVTAG